MSEKLEIEWSGYIRTSLITPELAKLMVRSGVGDLEVAITSGSQEVLNNLHMGFKLERLYDGCRYLAEAGFKGKVILNYSLNSPKETEESLLQSVESYKNCLLYTSDAADDLLCVDLGGRRIIKKKNTQTPHNTPTTH